MLARRCTDRPRPAVRAIDRACQAWQGVAVVTRHDARHNGVRGDLRQLDEVASGHRGKSVPRGMSMLAREMKAAGIPRSDAAARLRDMAELIAALTYDDGPHAA